MAREKQLQVHPAGHGAGHQPLPSCPPIPTNHHSLITIHNISNRPYRRLEFNISPRKQRTEVLSNRSKSGVIWRQIDRPCRGYAQPQERSFGSDSRPSECDGKSKEARVSAQDDGPGRKAKKRLTATVAKSTFELTGCKQGTSRFSSSNKNGTLGICSWRGTSHTNIPNLLNLESPRPWLRRGRHDSPAAAKPNACHLFTTPRKTNCRVSTSKKSARVLAVPEVYTAGRFLRRSL